MAESVEVSATYGLFLKAMVERKQLVCTYNGLRREVCPIILGRSNGREKALTFQFGGLSSRGLVRGGAWRCLWLDEVHDVELREGRWHSGGEHRSAQQCVDDVEYDVNPQSPFDPRYRL